MSTIIVVITSIDEIKEADVRYAHTSKPNKYISIDKEPDGTFTVYGYISGDHPTAVTVSGNMCKEWITFEGAKRSLKQFAKNGQWGMSHWNTTN